MGRNIIDRFYQPFIGLAESAVTSTIIDTRLAFDVTVSFNTTSGTTSAHTYQISNDAAGVPASGTPAEASWSHWTVFGDVTWASGSTTFDPPLGYAWARVLRDVSNGSFDIDIHVLYR